MKKGFTLIEVLIALIILVIGVVAIVGAFSKGMLSSSDVENMDLALNIAQGKLEEIKDSGYANLTTSGPTVDPNFSNFDVIVALGPTADPRRVDVTVEWETQSGVTKGQIPSVSIVLTTLIADY